MFGCPQSRSNPNTNIYSPIFPYFLFLLLFFSNKRFIHFFMAAFQNNVVVFKISVHDVYHKLFIAHSCREQREKKRRQTPSVWQTIGNINRIFFHCALASTWHSQPDTIGIDNILVFTDEWRWIESSALWIFVLREMNPKFRIKYP